MCYTENNVTSQSSFMRTNGGAEDISKFITQCVIQCKMLDKSLMRARAKSND
jgi:hypothetical protein